MPEITEEFVARMEEVLKVYARHYNDREPVVCLDERPVMLRASARPGLGLRPGSPTRTDYEYVRCGTANAFCIVEPKTGRRLTHATDRRTNRRFAQALRKIARRYQRASTIHLVADNLSTHSKKACVETYGPREGQRLWSRFTLHYTPKHASWLNAAELECSLLARECIGRRRLHDLATVKREVRSWARRADRARRSIDWKFRVDDARCVFRYDGITTTRAEH